MANKEIVCIHLSIWSNDLINYLQHLIAQKDLRREIIIKLIL